MIEVLDNDETIRVGGRAARLIHFLARQAERINKPEKMQITFDCAGNSFSVELKERMRPLYWQPGPTR
jgi:hypothetical protein